MEAGGAASWGSGGGDGEGRPFNACGIHPEEPATFTCSRCGTFGCPTCLGVERPMPLCYGCAERGAAAVPWERREQIGTFEAFKQTTKMVLTQPTNFFARPSAEGFTGAATYGALVYTLGWAAFAVMIAVIYGGLGIAIGNSMPHQGGAALGGVGMGMIGCFGGIATLIQAPIYAVVSMVVSLAGNHASLLFMGQARGSWEDSVRAVAYANAAYILMWIPCLGWIAPTFIVPIFEIIGMREIHGTTTGVAVAAVLLWRFLIVGIFAFFYVMIFASVISGLMSA